MNQRLFRQMLLGAIAALFIGCGGAPVESTADRIEVKKEEWRRQRSNAQERFEEVASRLSPDQRQRLRGELEREFDEGDRSLETSRLR